LRSRANPTPHNKLQFINKFPLKENQSSIWDLHSANHYPLGILPPYFGYLSQLARKNDFALQVLISGMSITDGAHSESLSEAISDLYISGPLRVDKYLMKLNVQQREIDFIHETAAYKKGRIK
jgi:hypothetical protein